MSHLDWSLCRDVQVRKTDNRSSQQRSQLDRVTDLGEKLPCYADPGYYSPSLPIQPQNTRSSDVFEHYHCHLGSFHVLMLVENEPQTEDFQELQQMIN